ncbi:MAG: rhomboid family protein [Caulobacteraceae bacterium]|nr:rhomboid family protein [Caulobacter sp.]
MSAAALPLTRQRCWNHAEREAAARCPSCGRFFCRECVTEHAGRMVCAACLRTQLAAATRRPPDRARARQLLRAAALQAWRAAQVGAGVLTAWFFFHLVAQWLVSLPEQFHDGAFWKQSVLGEPGE